jgi:two-component system, LytTR family, sensor kinase
VRNADLETRESGLPSFMNPVVFLGIGALLAALFALQEWVEVRQMSRHISLTLLLEAWGVQYLLWAAICWLLWRYWGGKLQTISLRRALIALLPLSIFLTVIEEMLWVLCFPNLPLWMPHMNYWSRLVFQLRADLADGVVIFWCAFFVFRGVGYYQRFREKEATAARLEAQLARAQLHAMRTNLNPHFLFNTLNGISSLMQSDVAAADLMLEQFSSLLRICLERGDAQLISLREEMEFNEMYMALQERRFAGRVGQEIHVQPELYDALVPTMILQPILENAYQHGLSQISSGGQLKIDARKEDGCLRLDVLNSGIGLGATSHKNSNGHKLGLMNVQERLRLHYRDKQTFSIREVSANKVLVSITLPLQISQTLAETFTRYGA